jgi:hypothetical protein
MPIAEITHDIASIQDDVTARYFADLAQAEPERDRTEATINRTGRYMFRTRAGTTEQVSIFLPTITNDQLLDDKLSKVWQQRYERKYGAAGVDAYEALKTEIGSHRIKFTRIHPGQMKGCYWGTDSEMAADFLRVIIKGGKIDGLYEDFKDSAKLRSRYTETLFENTETGRKQLADHDLAIERAVRESERIVAKASVTEPLDAPMVNASVIDVKPVMAPKPTTARKPPARATTRKPATRAK